MDIKSDLHINEIYNVNDPIHWLQIKSQIQNKVLFNIPYSPAIKINDYKTAVYKSFTPMENSYQDQILRIIENINLQKKISAPIFNELKNFNLEINLATAPGYSYTQLFFIVKALQDYGFVWVEKNKIEIKNASLLNKEQNAPLLTEEQNKIEIKNA